MTFVIECGTIKFVTNVEGKKKEGIIMKEKTLLEKTTIKKFNYSEQGDFLNIEIADVKKFTYSNRDVRQKHINEMEQEGWTNHGQVKENIGISDRMPIYRFIGNFYKITYRNVEEL